MAASSYTQLSFQDCDLLHTYILPITINHKHFYPFQSVMRIFNYALLWKYNILYLCVGSKTSVTFWCICSLQCTSLKMHTRVAETGRRHTMCTIYCHMFMCICWFWYYFTLPANLQQSIFFIILISSSCLQ